MQLYCGKKLGLVCLLYILQVRFWSQHISFWLIGIMIITSIRGLLITLTKVGKKPHELS